MEGCLCKLCETEKIVASVLQAASPRLDLHQRVRVETSAQAWNSVCYFYIKNKCSKGGNCPGKHYERPTPADLGKVNETATEIVSDETKCAMMMKEYKLEMGMISKEVARAWYAKLPDEQ